MEMNPGYMTFVVLLATGILLSSGWKDYFFNGLSYKSIVFFMAGWLTCSFYKFHFYLPNIDIQLNLAFVFLLLFSGYLLIRLKSSLERLNIITVSLVLCLLDFTFREASGLAMEYIAIWLALAVACLQKSPTKQLASLLLGFLCSNVLSIIAHQHTQIFQLADQSYQDLWWFTVLLSRLFTVMFENFVISFRKWYGGFFERNK
jgi:hypothetical protein